MKFDLKRNKVHCFSCNADYDIFDLIGIDYNITDCKKIFEKAYEIYNIKLSNNENSFLDKQFKYNNYINNKIKNNFKEYFKKCNNQISNTNYLEKRGFSLETINKYMLGYEPNYKNGNEIWQAIIIPTSDNTYVVRNTNLNADKKNRIRKYGPNQIYNIDIIKDSNRPIFVVEGELDALSIIELGFQAISLGSTSNYKKFVQKIKNYKINKPFIIALDNDEQGHITSKKLANELEQLNISFYELDIYNGYKDANEALISNKNLFKESLIKAENTSLNIFINNFTLEKKSYLEKSTKYFLKDFIKNIITNYNISFIPTGFNKLDNVLDGGLYEGLCAKRFYFSA